jgi:N-dimethylarginine dimethylaminohydrolase
MTSEFSAAPGALLVHDPVAAGGLGAMCAARENGELEREWLFRELPEEARYARQHRAFVETLRANASQVLYLADLVGDTDAYAISSRNPNQVFTRDSLITIPWAPAGYIGARLKEPLRRTETRTLTAAARSLGLSELVRLPEDVFLEGGDVIPLVVAGRRTLLVGYGPRSNLAALEFLQAALIPEHLDEVIGVELAPWRLNLDGGLLPIAEDVVVADVSCILGGVSLDATGRRSLDVLGMLRDIGMHLIETTREESIYSQSCNAVCLGNRRAVYYDLCERVNGLLRRHDVETILVPGSELVKGRGGPRCMTRPIYATASAGAKDA